MSSPTSPQFPTSSPSHSFNSSSIAFSPIASSPATTSSLSLSSSISSSLPSWHFPFGPSSRYHQRSQRTHQRVKTSYTPRAPVLSTEQRAHRRAQNNSLGGHPSPASSEYSRSPLSRFSSYGSNTSKNSATMARANGAPLTPAKAPRRTSSLQDSPFSDYFSDDARSSLSANVPAPSTETKALLVKMNKLQSKLMRDQSEKGRDAIKIVGRKLAEIDLELDALHSQSSLTTELRDSGVFMPDEKTDAHISRHSREPSCQSCGSLDSSVASSRIFDEDGATLQQYQAERAWYLSHMRETLEKLNTVQAELRQRHADFTELHDQHYTILEEKEAEIEQLRSENEGLRQDLGFEYSELLFLKLQVKSMEVDIDDLRNESSGQFSDTKCSKKNEILSEMDRWRTDSDWQDVEARFKRRRSRYGIPTSPIRKDNASLGGATTAKDEIDWQLETVREGRGRITSLTIKRTDSSQSVSQCTALDNGAEQTAETVTLSGPTDFTPLEQLDTCISKADVRSYEDHCTQTDMSLERSQYVQCSSVSRDQYDQEDEEDISSKKDETPQHQEEEVEEEEEEDCCTESDIDAHDCAITTSTSSEADEDPYQDVEEDDETILEEPTLLSVPHKSAWQELWSSLQSLTGIPDDDEDDY
ncbi:hypothetical protein Slin15195_G008930 [Septoria linicola]|uniref:Uncharacterized protein n=1 Tax=Septoria linicola TaxID=215465 RepID=A0A9Q9AH62_9PEZI|nr:hypothetical protein Slin14017_G008940 [Septoria linicola]USW47574.1 hypothetical protein Slin15195_G008930 [Septoria linicola]